MKSICEPQFWSSSSCKLGQAYNTAMLLPMKNPGCLEKVKHGRGKRVALYSKKWATLYKEGKSGCGAHPGLFCLKNDASSTYLHYNANNEKKTFHLKFQIGHMLCASDSYNRVCCRGNNLIIYCMALYLFLIFTSLFHFKPA